MTILVFGIKYEVKRWRYKQCDKHRRTQTLMKTLLLNDQHVLFLMKTLEKWLNLQTLWGRCFWTFLKHLKTLDEHSRLNDGCMNHACTRCREFPSWLNAHERDELIIPTSEVGSFRQRMKAADCSNLNKKRLIKCYLVRLVLKIQT